MTTPLEIITNHGKGRQGTYTLGYHLFGDTFARDCRFASCMSWHEAFWLLKNEQYSGVLIKLPEPFFDSNNPAGTSDNRLRKGRPK